MVWLQSIDTALFRFANQSLVNPVFDWLMRKLAGDPRFIPVLLGVAALLLWKGGRRGRVFVILLALTIILGDTLVCNTIKNAVGRLRPCAALADTRLLVGFGLAGSMPSSHAANWFAAAMVAFIFYRRSWRVMVPAAALVGFSRIYDGVHYPSDVLAGAILGGGYAAGLVWSADALWRWAGQRWFPLWWQRFPSLMDPDSGRESSLSLDRSAPSPQPSPRTLTPALSHPMGEGEMSDVLRERSPQFGGSKREPTLGEFSPPMGEREKKAGPGGVSAAQHWLRLGYVLIGAILLFRLGYIASDTISLSKDEAYQWLWSKHLALSYYSKPAGIALIQFVGTSLWGDTQLGVRFFSPVFAAILSLVLLRFMARNVGARPGFLLLLLINCTPLMGMGTVLMTVDPPLVLCWTLAMLVGWRAVQPEGTARDWAMVGLATGLGFLCKYNAAYLILCYALFFALWAPARVHLRRLGPYVALVIFAVCTLPVIIWNSQHAWITALHVSENAGLGTPWEPTLKFFWDFLGAEAGLLNPVFFVGALWAMVAFWKRRRENPLWVFFFCMGAPVFLGHWLYSLHSRVFPNWIAPAVLPMFCLMTAYWNMRWQEGVRAVKGWLVFGLVLGLVAVTFMHESNLIGKITGQPLPAEKDPLRRVRAWKETAACVEEARQKLLQEGKPTFIISDHYGMAGLFSFYLPAARASLRPQPLVYYQTSPKADNQLWFWPEYRYGSQRTGQNAIYVSELDPYPLETGWLWKWLARKEVRYANVPPPTPAPSSLVEEFESVSDLGVKEIKLGHRVFRRVQLWECRNLKAIPKTP